MICEDRGYHILWKGYVLTDEQPRARLLSNREASCIRPHFSRGLDKCRVYVQEHSGHRIERRVEEHGMGLDLEHI